MQELETFPLVLHLSPEMELTDEQFYKLCQLNRDLRIERTSTGELLIMPPTGSGTGNRNSKLNQQLSNWTDEDGTGVEFDSSTGFILPNGAKVSPDAAWVRLERWNALSEEEQERFACISPDFVVELRSPSDSLQSLKNRMEEYIANQVRLGWLIDRKQRKVYIYRPGVLVECLDNPATLSGDPVLRGFVLNLSRIW